MEISLAVSNDQQLKRWTEEDVVRWISDSRPWLYRLALSITANPDLSEDIAQEACIRANRKRIELRAVAEPKAWLRTVLVRCAINAITRQKPTNELDAAIQCDPTDSIAVRRTLERLSPEVRVLLALAHFEQLTYAEIGEVLGIPEGTVASRLHAARESFRIEWQK